MQLALVFADVLLSEQKVYDLDTVKLPQLMVDLVLGVLSNGYLRLNKLGNLVKQLVTQLNVHGTPLLPLALQTPILLDAVSHLCSFYKNLRYLEIESL